MHSSSCSDIFIFLFIHDIHGRELNSWLQISFLRLLIIIPSTQFGGLNTSAWAFRSGTVKLTSFDNFGCGFVGIFLEILNEQATKLGDFFLEVGLAGP